MKQLITLTLCLIITFNLFAQDDQLTGLVRQGIAFHDQGKYEEAIAKYKEALAIDKKSTLVNYELSYSYFALQEYDEAIKHSTFVIKQKADNLHAAYMVLGSSLDLAGKPAKAIKTYEDGLAKFPNSNLLNYNLALTCFNQKEYKKAEVAAMNAILAKPTHGTSHLILSAIMQQKGEKVKSILPIYYFLMIEPDTKGSLINYKILRNQLGQGVEKKDDKNINVTIPFGASASSEFSAAEMMISLLAASQHSEENKAKNEMELFAETNKGLFSVLGELKKDESGFWWDIYVSTFYELVQSENFEAYSYFISQSTNNELVYNWIADHNEEMKKFEEWLKKIK